MLRKFSTTSLRSASFYARTVLSPHSGLKPPVLAFSPKAVLLFSTPKTSTTAINYAFKLKDDSNIQVVLAAVDRIVPNSSHSGISELWLEEPTTIGKSHVLDQNTQLPLRESDGVNPVGAKVHWKPAQGNMELEVAGTSISLSLANTLFANKMATTLFYFEPNEEADVAVKKHSGVSLTELSLALPALTPPLQPPVTKDRWTLLTGSEHLLVTRHTGNLLKGINGKPAASFLEKNKTLMEIASKDTKVYVKVYNKVGECKRYEVIAGGGGWGAKADLLALSPEAVLNDGDRIEFFMITPTDRFATPTTALVPNSLIFECVHEADTYDGNVPTYQVVENHFGGGSELGFVANGVNYRSPGDQMSFSYGL